VDNDTDHDLRVITIRAEPITVEGFAPFGQVVGREEVFIEAHSGEHLKLDIATYEWEPLTVKMVNRHFKATQAQIALNGKPNLIVVGPKEIDVVSIEELELFRAFVCDGSVGFNLSIGTWHGGAYPISERVDLLNIQGDKPFDDVELRYIDKELGAVIEVKF
jgi:ureidoglycolate hydrolase